MSRSGFEFFKHAKVLAKDGKKSTTFKRPAVVREHLAHCTKLDSENPLVVLSRWTREGDVLKASSGKPVKGR